MYNKSTDIEKLYLLPEEKFFLFRLKWKKHLKLPANMLSLYEADLVDYDLLDERDAFHQPLRSDTVHLTKKYYRWHAYRRESERWFTLRYVVTNIIVPIIVGVASSVITTLLLNGKLPFP